MYNLITSGTWDQVRLDIEHIRLPDLITCVNYHAPSDIIEQLFHRFDLIDGDPTLRYITLLAAVNCNNTTVTDRLLPYAQNVHLLTSVVMSLHQTIKKNNETISKNHEKIKDLEMYLSFYNLCVGTHYTTPCKPSWTDL